MQALLNIRSERRWLRYMHKHLRHLSGTSPNSPATTSGCAPLSH
jgi:hypothetical protein